MPLHNCICGHVPAICRDRENDEVWLGCRECGLEFGRDSGLEYKDIEEKWNAMWRYHDDPVPVDVLLPCPYCGGVASVLGDVTYTDDAGRQHEEWWCGCDNSGCRGGIYNMEPGCHSKEDAIRIWNTRAERTCRNTDPDDDTFFTCSACGAECSVEWCHSGWGVPSFCPHCGAKVVL